MAAEVGEKAPDFTLPSDDWENQVSLEEARSEGPVVLFFYPGDWSSVCTDQMGQLQEQIGRFGEKGATVLGISVDSPWSHKAWAEERGIEFPLLSDFGLSCRPKGRELTRRPAGVEEVLEDLEKAL